VRLANPTDSPPRLSDASCDTSVTITRAAGNNEMCSPARGKPGSRLVSAIEGMREATIIRRACHNSPRTRRCHPGVRSRQNAQVTPQRAGTGLHRVSPDRELVMHIAEIVQRSMPSTQAWTPSRTCELSGRRPVLRSRNRATVVLRSTTTDHRRKPPVRSRSENRMVRRHCDG
jgi:hypothetical protein